jgi:catechol 2,3-dioxygenase-like lactoylglutathione lyase family enzyme
MTTQKQSLTSTEFSIHPATRVGPVSLTVASLENQIAFYQQALGFVVHWHTDNKAGLGAGSADLLRLTEHPGFKRYSRVTGLYHFAVLFPNRRELARAMARLFVLKYPNSPTDHIMTKTTYLNDLEGNGIELYAESPEDGKFTIENDDFVTRRADGSLSDGREPLDVDELFSHLKKDDRLDVPPPSPRPQRERGRELLSRRARLRCDGHVQHLPGGVRLGRRISSPPRAERLAGGRRAPASARFGRPALLHG